MGHDAKEDACQEIGEWSCEVVVKKLESGVARTLVVVVKKLESGAVRSCC